MFNKLVLNANKLFSFFVVKIKTKLMLEMEFKLKSN